MSPATILVGRVKREELIQNLDAGEGVSFKIPPQITLLEDGANAVLVVLEPEQSPIEVAETILWALR